ncbi:hypothetical protein AA309_14385 [Microvirga vignae]|uniref:Uncharacterized protein n=1 Tax=Microvirga vignae TaxID=1225564 RepID=A0A0H1RIT4_9HYPH|nr:hypothetical protein AA309_14385 [Microvirga vignae]
MLTSAPDHMGINTQGEAGNLKHEFRGKSNSGRKPDTNTAGGYVFDIAGQSWRLVWEYNLGTAI